jgi:hypothetical protein
MLMRRAAVTIAALTLAWTVGAAQQPQTPAPARPATPEQTASAPTAGQPVNVKVELTITDQSGPSDAARRTVTLIVADRQNGSIRSTGSVRNQGPVGINVDARPFVLSGGNLRLELALEYNPRITGAADSGGTASSLNERITVMLEGGKPLLISQAADAASVSDRRISVEVKATVLK